MSRKSYSEEEIALIASCPYVKSVTEKSVRYTSSFMQILVDEAEGGKGALEIFDAYDVPWRVIGRESAMQAAYNWVHKAKAGQSLTDQTGRPRTRDLTKDEIIARQQAKIEMLQQENDFLRQIRRLERRHQPSKSPSKKDSR